MEAPKCRACGERHWSRVCSDVTKPSVTDVPPVTKPSVTPRLIAPSKLDDAQREIEALRAEVGKLKVELAKAHGGRPPKGEQAMSAAERQRQRRARPSPST